MLPEQMARFLEDEDFKRLSTKLEHAMSSDYFYSRNKAEMLDAIVEIIEATYNKARKDERYCNGGPLFALYDKLY
jgi:hypothetical protein